MSIEITFKALSDPVRRDIIHYLKEGRMSAGDIASKFDVAFATISYHLTILKKSSLIRETKVKNFVYYELNLSVFEDLLLWFSDFTGGESDE